MNSTCWKPKSTGACLRGGLELGRASEQLSGPLITPALFQRAIWIGNLKSAPLPSDGEREIVSPLGIWRKALDAIRFMESGVSRMRMHRDHEPGVARRARQRLGVRQSSGAFVGATIESARGLAHSKTWRRVDGSWKE